MWNFLDLKGLVIPRVVTFNKSSIYYLMTVNVQVELKDGSGVRVMVFNATFNNFSVILWLSVLLVKEYGVPGENHRPVASH